MPSQDGIRQEIGILFPVVILLSVVDKITQDIFNCKLNGKAISVFSPLDIDVTDQGGNHTVSRVMAVFTMIFRMQILKYGPSTKFLYLPTDEGQVYTTKVRGTGDGTFTLKDATISDNQVTNTQVFSNVPVTTQLKGTLNISAPRFY